MATRKKDGEEPKSVELEIAKQLAKDVETKLEELHDAMTRAYTHGLEIRARIEQQKNHHRVDPFPHVSVRVLKKLQEDV